MGTHIISQSQLDEFIEEEPTDPMVLLTAQDQLNAAVSVARFDAALDDRRPHWTARLSQELDDGELLDLVDLVEIEPNDTGGILDEAL